jgi:hypothetical protein
MKLIYIDCSEGVSSEALLGAMLSMNPLKSRPIIAELKNCLRVDCDLKVEAVTWGSYTGARYVLNCSRAGEHVNATGATEKILDWHKITPPVRSGFNLFFERFTTAWSQAQNIPADKLRLELDRLVHITVMGISYFTALAHLNVRKIMATPIPVPGSSAFTLNKEGRFLAEILKGTCIGQTKNKTGTATDSTLTGMSLMASSVDEYGPIPELCLEEVSCGIHADESQNETRVHILGGNDCCRESAPDGEEDIIVLETSIDDMNPEIFPYLMEQLLRNGALDAFLTPLYMKKGRPANLLTILCRKEKIEPLLAVVFKETTTLGIRIREEKRRVLFRKKFMAATPYGEISIKAGFTREGTLPVQIAPEFEDCKKIAAQQGVPLKEVYAAAQRAAYESIKRQFA